MIIGRLFGYIFLFLMLIVLGAEVLRFLEGGHDRWISIAQIIDSFGIVTGTTSEEEGIAGIWQNLLAPMLDFPAFFSFMIVAGILFFMTRNRFR
jgi:hypothetical protein